jgi:hypothetical protein
MLVVEDQYNMENDLIELLKYHFVRIIHPVVNLHLTISIFRHHWLIIHLNVMVEIRELLFLLNLFPIIHELIHDEIRM